MNKIENWQLKQRQSLSLDVKIARSKLRIKEFYEKMEGKVYVSFSGGKDSTVLLHLVRSIYPNVVAVFSNTGLEYPEIVNFVKTVENVIIVRPKLTFKEVLEKYGYPIVSKKVSRQIRDLQAPTSKNKATRTLYLTGIKRDGTKTKFFKLPKKWMCLIDAPFKTSDLCCKFLKKSPLHNYEQSTKNRPFIGTMASDSHQRESSYLQTGCNSFVSNRERSNPLGFWLEKDIWEYIKKHNLSYSKIYDMGEHNTGCVFCMFGVHLEKQPNRFQRMQTHHPKLYDYCINTLEIGKVLDYIKIPYKK